MNRFQPELGQFIFGSGAAPYAVPDYVRALLEHILSQFERVYWNVHQEPFDIHSGETTFAGITWRPYYWGDDETIAALPNFAFEGVEIHWYKHLGRSMSTNCDRETSDWWVAWFNRCIASIEAADRRP